MRAHPGGRLTAAPADGDHFLKEKTVNRFKQPSTWAGIAGMAQMLAVFLPPQYSWIAHAITAGAGSAAVGLNEQAAP